MAEPSAASSSPHRTYATISSRVPRAVRLPLACALSLALSMSLNTAISEYTGLQLAAPSRYIGDNWKIGAILGWKAAQIATAWSVGYDWLDLMALSFLTNYPYYYLLNAFWSLSSMAMTTSLAIDVASMTLPFALLRPAMRPRQIKTANQAIAADSTIMGLFALQGIAIYACFFYLGYYLDRISVFMVQYFDILTLESAHNSSLLDLAQHFAINGVMAMVFLFKPAMAAPSRPSLTEGSYKGDSSKAFHPATATLRETVAYNFGLHNGEWSHRAEILAKRIAVLATCVFANTAIRVFATVEGTHIIGALGWSGLWTVATVLVGLAYTMLENEY